MSNNKLESSITHHKEFVNSSKRSIIDNFITGVSGGALLGLGLTAEAVGIAIEQPLSNYLGMMPLVLGGLVVRDSYKEIKQRTNWALEDQTKVVRGELELEKSAQA